MVYQGSLRRAVHSNGAKRRERRLQGARRRDGERDWIPREAARQDGFLERQLGKLRGGGWRNIRFLPFWREASLVCGAFGERRETRAEGGFGERRNKCKASKGAPISEEGRQQGRGGGCKAWREALVSEGRQLGIEGGERGRPSQPPPPPTPQPAKEVCNAEPPGNAL